MLVALEVGITVAMVIEGPLHLGMATRNQGIAAVPVKNLKKYPGLSRCGLWKNCSKYKNDNSNVINIFNYQKNVYIYIHLLARSQGGIIRVVRPTECLLRSQIFP